MNEFRDSQTNNWNCAANIADLAEEYGFFSRLNDESIGVVPLNADIVEY